MRKLDVAAYLQMNMKKHENKLSHQLEGSHSNQITVIILMSLHRLRHEGDMENQKVSLSSEISSTACIR